ncbi:hypothetical protein DPEC_G00280860 [Dallia pectoralis]|uniref:Uncharacterized protein n=1 Tax=Dallia pectoralis TaxID=75939 RepID=A0ACC2FMH7_DALPE|nr:hypothetical protein DPEC_G00280860 [Dallia pectoralis]
MRGTDFTPYLRTIKMTLEGCYRICKKILTIFIAKVAVVGIAMFGFGLWLRTSSETSAMFATDSNAFVIGVTMLCVSGTLFLLVAALGQYGVLRENRIALGVFTILLGMLAVVQIVIGLMSNKIMNELGEQVGDLYIFLYKRVATTGGRDISDVLVTLHLMLRCCGLDGGLDPLVEKTCPLSSYSACPPVIHDLYNAYEPLMNRLYLGTAALLFTVLVCSSILMIQIKRSRQSNPLDYSQAMNSESSSTVKETVLHANNPGKHHYLFSSKDVFANYKMALDGCGQICKCLLIIFNIIVALVGIVMFGFGLWIRMSSVASGRFNTNMFDISVTVVIVLGAVLLLMTGFGIYGACSENRNALNVFSALLAILFGLQIATGISGYILRDYVVKLMARFYMTVYAQYVTKGDPGMSVALTIIQNWLQCCGLLGALDPLVQNTCPETSFVKKFTFPACPTVILDLFDSKGPQVMGFFLGTAVLLFTALMCSSIIMKQIKMSRQSDPVLYSQAMNLVDRTPPEAYHSPPFPL